MPSNEWFDHGQGKLVTPTYRVGAVNQSTGNAVASSTAVLAGNPSRHGAILYNDSSSAMYLTYGATASTALLTYKILAGGTWEMGSPIYSGAISGLWDTAVGTYKVTEI